MKKIFTVSLLLALFVVFNNAKAQTDQSAPTQQDALNFINKVYSECAYSDNFAQTEKSSLSAKLDGCILTISYIYNSGDPGAGNGDHYYNTQFETIDLSSVYIKDALIRSNTTGDIKVVINVDEVKPNGKLRFPSSPINQVYKAFNTYEFINSAGDFKDNNYGERLIKAYEFLIKSCGGGTIKVDPNEKF